MTGTRRKYVKLALRFVTAVCAVGLALVGAATPAHAASGDALYRIVNANSNLCLTVAGGSSSPNAVGVQYTCDTDPSRYWKFVTGGNAGPDFHIVNRNSGLCLTIAGASTAVNAKAVQYSCDTDPSRRWLLTSDSGGTYKLLNRNSGLCLTIAGASTALNATAVQYNCDFNLSRYWRVTFAGTE
jgi:cytolethal distending toxin subunit A